MLRKKNLKVYEKKENFTIPFGSQNEKKISYYSLMTSICKQVN